jgi:CBS domain-containing protein
MLRAARSAPTGGRCPSLAGCLNDALRGAHRAAVAAAGGAPQPLAAAFAPRRGVATAMDLLKRKNFHDSMIMIAETATMRDAAAKLAAVEGNKALLVTRAADGRVVGLLSVADVLRALRNPAPGADGLDRPAREFMTPSPTVVYAAPDDNLMALSLLMTERRVSHLPILDHGQVVGLISINDIVRMTLEQVRGGKANAVGTVLPRRGLAADTRVATRSPMEHHPSTHTHGGSSSAASSGGGQHDAGRDDRLGLATGVASLPRQARSPAPIEDAFFVAHVKWPRVKRQHQHQHHAAAVDAAAAGGVAADAAPPDDGSGNSLVSYVGVADGVGSWRGVGVNPRDYAVRLMEHAAEAVWRAAVARAPPPSPQAALTAAWEATNAEQVVGSATAVVLMLDAAQSECSACARWARCG